ncbi:hypothetical protein DPMN_038052 [Dreissena polymorpha]|uniref:Uncharacterized protein n=1 Tax=Dreissena polymorpha TaxID=45954 RepID=A0A9D4RNB6_DREPO|nr:hypothetical protein DPMN_038052 [Dreissena polymorpha]
MVFHCAVRARKSSTKSSTSAAYTICTPFFIRVKAQSHYDGTGNKRDGTVAPPGPIQTPAELRQRSGGALVNAGKVPV